MGTPAIGQLDSDNLSEIVVPGYSSSGKKIYAVNHDGIEVEGFPVDVGERMIVGVALQDFNNNGRDDIVFGSDSDNISLMYDDGTIAWTYQTGDKVQSAPSILTIGSDILVHAIIFRSCTY
jgi:outer membrane protein assembly factor BamB